MVAQDDAVAGVQTREARVGPLALQALACRPPQVGGWVVFALGGGGLGAAGRQVARMLLARGLGTLRVHLLRPGEAAAGADHLLAARLLPALEWLESHEECGARPVGLFGTGPGAVAALRVAAERPQRVAAVVACGGGPDLAREGLGPLLAPTLLVVGGLDAEVLRLNREALPLLAGERRLEVVPGAGPRFDEPGAPESVGHLAVDWFVNHLPAPPA